jgi:chromosome segregation ATPase
MNFKALIHRSDKVDKAIEKVDKACDELQAEMAEALDENLLLDDPPPSEDEGTPEENSPAIESSAGPQQEHPAVAEELPAPVDVPADSPEMPRRLTSHTQSRLAALNSFDGLHHEAQAHLQEINAKLSEVANSHRLTREFFNILYADIHRANELELANAGLVAEQRKLSEQLRYANRKQQELENAAEAMQQREAGLTHDNEALRAALAGAKLELVEAANTITRNEAELGDLIKTLSARTVEVERRSRENELLREKHVSLSIDFDKAMKREAEARHKLDELSAIHTNEAARHSELLITLGRTEKEVLRLQKSLEIAQMKQSETTEAMRIMEADREAEIDRSLAEMRGLRSEIQSLQARLELAANENSEASSEIAKLKVQLSDAVAEKHVADERLSALLKENEHDKMNLLAASTNFSQLSLQQASEQIQLDIRKQECEDLRAEIASLNTRIKELLPYERFYRVTKARQHDTADDMDGADVAGLAAGKRVSSRRGPASGRRRAV